MSDVVFGKRDIRAIKVRKRADQIYRISRKLVRKVFRPATPVHNVIVYPQIADLSILEDVVNRLSFGLRNCGHIKVNIPVSEKLSGLDVEKLETPEYQSRYIDQTINIDFNSSGTFNELLKSDRIILWKSAEILTPKLFGFLHKVLMADRDFYMGKEASVWPSLSYIGQSAMDSRKMRMRILSNFTRFLKKCSGKKKAYCFVTGPTFDQYQEFNYEQQSIKIICNSIVKNKQFIDFIGGPDLLAFNDPVFHFSPCEYSSTFRETMLDVVEKYDCYIVCNEGKIPILLNHFPQLADKVIGLQTVNNLVIPSPEKPFHNGTGNVYTNFMLPMATAAADEIITIGADGRKPEENYFWKHSSSVQFDSLMQSAFETHPAFFRDRDYEDYYFHHCQNVEQLMSFGEEKGKQYSSLTPSYIPALKERYSEQK
jgi:hypothetical protein